MAFLRPCSLPHPSVGVCKSSLACAGLPPAWLFGNVVLFVMWAAVVQLMPAVLVLPVAVVCGLDSDAKATKL
jgi:hypothetical protein